MEAGSFLGLDVSLKMSTPSTQPSKFESSSKSVRFTEPDISWVHPFAGIANSGPKSPPHYERKSDSLASSGSSPRKRQREGTPALSSIRYRVPSNEPKEPDPELIRLEQVISRATDTAIAKA